MVFQNRILNAGVKTPCRQVPASLQWLLAALLTLTGCGQKGPLFLPAAPQVIQKVQGATPAVESQPSSTLPAVPNALSASDALESVR